jgi:hypothetical protein
LNFTAEAQRTLRSRAAGTKRIVNNVPGRLCALCDSAVQPSDRILRTERTATRANYALNSSPPSMPMTLPVIQ